MRIKIHSGSSIEKTDRELRILDIEIKKNIIEKFKYNIKKTEAKEIIESMVNKLKKKVFDEHTTNIRRFGKL